MAPHLARSNRLRAFGAVLTVMVLAGCGAGPASLAIPSPVAVPGAERVPVACRAAMATAAALAATEDATGSLDDAIRSCTTLEDWGMATAMYPAVLHGASPDAVLGARCDDLQGLAATPLCQALDR